MSRLPRAPLPPAPRIGGKPTLGPLGLISAASRGHSRQIDWPIDRHRPRSRGGYPAGMADKRVLACWLNGSYWLNGYWRIERADAGVELPLDKGRILQHTIEGVEVGGGIEHIRLGAVAHGGPDHTTREERLEEGIDSGDRCKNARRLEAFDFWRALR